MTALSTPLPSGIVESAASMPERMRSRIYWVDYDLIDELTDAESQKLRSKRQGRRIDSALGRQQMALWYATMGRFEDAIETNSGHSRCSTADAPASGSHAAILHWGAGLHLRITRRSRPGIAGISSFPRYI